MVRFAFAGLICAAATLGGEGVNAQALAVRRAEEKTVRVDDRQRSYFVFAPPNARRAQPLVLVLHGGGGNARQMERYTRFNALARREGFIVCYPQGFENNWNDGRRVDFIPAHKQNVDDVKFLRQVVDDVGKQCNLNQSRVFVTGISNGAFMSHRLAAEASDVFAAIAPLVGGMGAQIAKKFAPQHPVSLFVIQGDADPLVPFGGGEVGRPGGRKRGKFIATSAMIAKYVKANGITGKPTKTMLPDKDTDDKTTTDVTRYPPGTQGALIQLYVIKNGGHAWPGRRPYASDRLIGYVSQDFDATEAIWQFFESCPPRDN